MKNNHHVDFIKYLQKLIDENKSGAIAALRHSLQSEATSQVVAYPYIVPFLPRKYRSNDWAYFLVAGLLATHPKHSSEVRNLGTTCRLLGTEEEHPTGAWVLRFKALLDAEQEDVAHHLRSIISMAASKSEPVNYERLLSDLCQWSDSRKFAQMNMAREFWKLPELQSEPTTENSSN